MGMKMKYPSVLRWLSRCSHLNSQHKSEELSLPINLILYWYYKIRFTFKFSIKTFILNWIERRLNEWKKIRQNLVALMSKPIEVRLDSVDFGGVCCCRRRSSCCGRGKTKSNLNPSSIELELGLGFHKILTWKLKINPMLAPHSPVRHS